MKYFKASAYAALALVLAACHQVNDERIPFSPVHVNMDNPGVWTSYGVHGYGDYNYFILKDGQPHGFPYAHNSRTGFGGVLLICGQNPFTGEIGPLAYDLACPVERMPDILLYIDPENYQAVCQECGSRYDVVEAGGSPVYGPAKAQNYAMTSYQCLPTINGGYIISD